MVNEKIKNILGSLILALALIYPVIISAADCRNGGYCASLAQQAAVGQAQAGTGLQQFLGLNKDAEIGDVLAGIYRFALGLVGLSALIMIVFGGISYMSAGDSQERVKQGKGYIQNAILGLVLALLSYLILWTINPDLVKKLQLPLVGLRQAQRLDLSTFAPETKEEITRFGGQKALEAQTGGQLAIEPKIIDPVDLRNQQGQNAETAVRQDFLKSCLEAGGTRVSDVRVGGSGSTRVMLTCVKR